MYYSFYLCRLLEQVPNEMAEYAVQWGKLMYPLLVHGAPKVRERAIVAIDLGMPALLTKHEAVGRALVADLKTVSFKH